MTKNWLLFYFFQFFLIIPVFLFRKDEPNKVVIAVPVIIPVAVFILNYTGFEFPGGVLFIAILGACLSFLAGIVVAAILRYLIPIEK